MKNTSFQRAVCIAACALAFCTAAVQAHAAQVSVRLDTGALSGNGWLDLQFNPGPNASEAASAVLSGFGGALYGDAEVIGDVSGALPGTVIFSNSTPYNDLFQPVSLGGLLSFLLDFSADFANDGFGSGSMFAVSLYGADGVSALGNPDPLTNALVSISLMPASFAGPGGVAVNVSDAVLASANAGAVTAVPEPASLLLVAAGMIALAAATGRRRRKLAFASEAVHGFAPPASAKPARILF